MIHHSFQLFKIRIIQHHSLTMISIKLVIGPTHGKCLLTQIPQNKHKKLFFQGNVLNNIIFPYISMIYQSPRLPFKSILGYILMKNSITILEKLSKVYKGIGLLKNLSNKLPRQALVTYSPSSTFSKSRQTII